MLPVVVMTGWATIDTAVEAMRRGARSLVQKPWDNTTLLGILEREIEDARAARQLDARRQRDDDDARLIQRSLLPVTPPRVGPYQLAAAWRPASGYGGDCYDVIPFKGALGLSIADVAGKGPAGRAAHVESTGRHPRIRARRHAAGRRVHQRQSAAVRPHDQRPLRHVLLSQVRSGTPRARVRECRTQSAAARCAPRARWSA